MLQTPADNFQPYDRDTGTELSVQQQSDCQYNYSIVKSYIDSVESQSETPAPWIRRKLRCSTAELLLSLDRLAQDIRVEERGRDTERSSGGDGSQESVFLSANASETATSNRSVEFYPQAVNLLHELVSRLVRPTDPPSSEGLEGSKDIPTVFVPASASTSSEVSGVLSNRPISQITSVSTRTASSMASVEAEDLPRKGKGKQESGRTGRVAFDIPAAVENDTLLGRASVDHTTDNIKKKQATNDWVLEYLRGGWLSNSPVTNTLPVVSPVFPMSELSSPAGSFPPPKRTDSDDTSLFGDDTTTRRDAAFSYVPRPHKRGRPIPTMASRFKDKAGHEEIHSTDRRSSNVSGPEFFKTPKSILSGNTVFCTPGSGPRNIDTIEKVGRTSSWSHYLRERGLIPAPFDEMDWSGRGQHAEFDATEEAVVPLTLEKSLGHSSTAIVESVRCKRIRLARKTVEVNRRLKREEVIKEVEHLQRLTHPHVIRVVGTYTLDRKLSILLYPVADYTLDQFLESIDRLKPDEQPARKFAVSTFFRCLAKGLAYIHENAMKHMDIKPKNLLVRDMRNSTICNQGQYKIYIADFGIARSYRSVEDCNTESRTSFTRMYAAPEVVAQEWRDQKADIFSLGAVYAEMLAVLAHETRDTSNLEQLTMIREANPDDPSYQANADKVRKWLKHLYITSYGFESDANHSPITELSALMLCPDPADRPTANTVVNNIPFLAFCCDVNGGPEPFEAADRPATRQLYDRSFEIAEADLRYFRCMVDGCVKVFWSREKLEYHELNGHGESFPSASINTDAGRPPPSPSGRDEQWTILPSRNKSVTSQTYDEDLHKELSEKLRWS